jgi:hypothetical protein
MAGDFNYFGLKCDGNNCGTLAAGKVNSDSGSVRIYDDIMSDPYSNLGYVIKR